MPAPNRRFRPKPEIAFQAIRNQIIAPDAHLRDLTALLVDSIQAFEGKHIILGISDVSKGLYQSGMDTVRLDIGTLPSSSMWISEFSNLLYFFNNISSPSRRTADLFQTDTTFGLKNILNRDRPSAKQSCDSNSNPNTHQNTCGYLDTCMAHALSQQMMRF